VVKTADVPVAQRVFEALKREIIEARLQPGAIVAEGTLAAAYGVSKAPIREALKRLTQLGLVRSVARVGYIVSNVNLGDLDEIFALRCELEPLAARLATARATQAQLDELERLALVDVHALGSPIEERAHLASANSDFHRAVAALSGNRRLELAVGSLVDELERVLHMLAYDPLFDEVASEHAELVAVMRAGDAEAAASELRRQLASDHELLRRVSLRSDGARALSL
jgi:DNA-binding GntR family transcriptional regulator